MSKDEFDVVGDGASGGGGSIDSGLTDGLGDWLSFDTDALSDLDWRDYSKVGTGGLIAWGAFATDFAGATLATIGYGIASNIVAVGNANVVVLNGLQNFVTELYMNANPRWAYLTAIGNASAELQQAGLLAFIIAVLEVVLIIAMARKAWEVVRP